MADVVLEKITHRFGEVLAVDAVSLRVPDHEFIVFVGPSGCGKTTTLRLIAGLEKVQEGTIQIGGRRVNRVAPADRNIAMVFQNFALYPHMTVAENMGFGLETRRVPRAEITRRVARVAALLEVDPLLKRRPSELSGGQKQRVALGRAIVRNPAVLLMDEPLSNLDAKLRVQMRGEIKKLVHELETTTVYVTHDQVEAMTMSDRILVMHRGCVQQLDTPHQVYHYPANTFVAELIGSPPMNLFPAELERENGSLCLRVGSARVALPAETRVPATAGQHVIAGVRPEWFRRVPLETPGAFVAGVEVVEPQGVDTILDLRAGDTKLVARVDGETPVRPGETIAFEPLPHKVRLFDPLSGDRIA